MNKDLERLKKEYQNIEIPDELAAVTRQALERGKQERERLKQAQHDDMSHHQDQIGKRENTQGQNGDGYQGSSPYQTQRALPRNRWVKRIVASAAAVFVLFTISVNTMPAFASSLENIPGIGKLVKVLQFNKGGAEGGQLTQEEGPTDVHAIGLHQQGDSDQITIRFQKDNKEQLIASSFHVQHREYPNTMTFSIRDARNFSAQQDLATLKKSRYVADAYEIISMDDTLIRFTIVFKEPVAYEVKEYKDPAEVVLTLKQGTSAEVQDKVYSVRTASHPFGEEQGMMEEAWIEEENVRILKDSAGTYLVEAGYYPTKEEAQAQVRKLEEQHGLQGQLHVEERTFLQTPAPINAQ
ncbi:DUF4179 domain-containing protein [Paenibacillus sp. SC116]|uniref:DUF4179 domain-containing protein n=1 Tax=Paenibacillus sp. SC116 TaxID=2968986 RepID=UPI00215A6C66|nr:DUF4179 domain-containing protein [Paenibacillus sp. SC116]MCR8845235.1 DUF4179 domain-containing protein [Paenibacillus sp. SC116]